MGCSKTGLEGAGKDKNGQKRTRQEKKAKRNKIGQSRNMMKHDRTVQARPGQGRTDKDRQGHGRTRQDRMRFKI